MLLVLIPKILYCPTFIPIILQTSRSGEVIIQYRSILTNPKKFQCPIGTLLQLKPPCTIAISGTPYEAQALFSPQCLTNQASDFLLHCDLHLYCLVIGISIISLYLLSSNLPTYWCTSTITLIPPELNKSTMSHKPHGFALTWPQCHPTWPI